MEAEGYGGGDVRNVVRCRERNDAGKHVGLGGGGDRVKQAADKGAAEKERRSEGEREGSRWMLLRSRGRQFRPHIAVDYHVRDPRRLL